MPKIKEVIQGKGKYTENLFYKGEKIERLDGASNLFKNTEVGVISGIDSYINLHNKSKANTIIGKDVCLFDESSSNKINGTRIYVKDNSHVNSIEGNSVIISDNASVDTVKVNVNPQIRHNRCILLGKATVNRLNTTAADVGDKAFVENIDSDKLSMTSKSKIENAKSSELNMWDFAYIKNAYIKKRLRMTDNSTIDNLYIGRENVHLEILENSQIKNIKGEKVVLNANNIKTNPKNILNNIEAEHIELLGAFNVNKIKGKHVKLSNNVKVKNLEVKNSLLLDDNVEVDNIFITGNNPHVEITGNVKINGQILFEKPNGTVLLKRDQFGNLSSIRTFQVKNGKIGGDYKPIGFEKVVGMDDLKQMLYEDVIKPSSKADDYTDYGLEPVNGFLLYGPPGCGKTFIINALAEETGRHFVNMPASSVVSSYLHGTSQKIAQKFNEAFENAPSLIFIDEVESLAPIRDSLNDGSCSVDINEQVTELLQQINNCKDKDVFVVFASNEPQKIDNAIKRTGRIDKKIYLGPPDLESRKAMFERNLKTIAKKENNINTTKLAEITNNYTAEDIRMVVRQAAIFAMRNRKNVSLDDLIHAIAITKPSLTDSMVESYKRKGDLV